MTLRKYGKLQEIIAWALCAISLLILLGEMTVSRKEYDTEKAAARFEKTLVSRMAELDGYMEQAFAADMDKWMHLPDLPSDMVIYKYVNDSLKFWDNQFTISNDDIVSDQMRVPTLTNPRAEPVSVLEGASEKPQLMDMGSKWFLVKARQKDNVRVIGGLIVIDDINGLHQNGTNPRLHLGGNFIVQTLDAPGVVPVCVDGEPVMHIFYNVGDASFGADTGMLWLSLLLFVIALMMLLGVHRNLPWYLAAVLLISSSIAAMYIYGSRTQADHTLFSPALYANGQVFYSLGALLLINLFVFLLIIYTMICRRQIWQYVERGGTAVRRGFVCVGVVGTVGILVYVALLFRNVIQNSNITLELYKLNSLSWFTLLIYLSFASLLISALMLLRLVRPVALGKPVDDSEGMPRQVRLIFSVFAAGYLVVLAAFAGFDKEVARQAIWASRLSMTRNVALELQLRSVENAIASDAVIAALSGLDGTESLIQGRIAENYLQRASQNYNMRVLLLGDNQSDPELQSLFRNRMQEGTGIADNSRFLYTITSSASTVYTGIFSYYVQGLGVVHMLLEIQPKSTRQDRGYASLLGLSSPSQVILPSNYSFARYSDRNLVSYTGNFDYPTYLNEGYYQQLYYSGQDHFKDDGYTHFINRIDTGTVIVISRPKIPASNYFLSVLFLAVMFYLTLSLVDLLRGRAKVKMFSRNYYRSTASMVLVISLVVTLVVMAAVSVLFVYERNDTNRRSMMSERVSSIQTLLQQECLEAQQPQDLDTAGFSNVLRMIADMSHTDISLYNTSGKVFMSTIPEVYERMLVSSRINQRAIDHIVYRNRRYYIRRESLGRRRFTAMYAPLFGADGQMLAIMNSPYVDENYDFRSEAIMHLVAIFSVFIILLLVARIAIEAVVDRIFKPLVEMGSKMNAADLDNLEYIEYDRDDEISSLVTAYNRMVHELTESSQKLAQAERDRAWSAMARQVAHEIKNPMTPMKLNIQRVIRLKERNDPAWQDRFDECMKVVLDHIDILTDTANQFSDFAKLYTEEPTLVDLDAMLKEEIAMFDNRDGIEFTYMGLEGCKAMAPKPQLVRVFVNLLTNSIQAIEGSRQAQADAGQTLSPGRIVVSLRHSSSGDGFYDIVFEDNGPGVSEENQGKLFTPNFTTKTSGTGLGLAICHNILQKCDATITYSRSFSLGGACFTIVYPGYRG